MQPKTILITGARKGIGKYIAQHYLQAGNNVIGCSRSEVDWEHNNYQHYQADVSDEISVKEMMSDIKRNHKAIDVLINNAGVAAMNHSLLTPMETVERVYKTNVFGSYLLMRETAKLMIPQKSGRIINFSSIAVPLNLEGEAAYAASKASVESLTKILAHEFGQYGITVNAVGPTAINTDLTKNIPEAKLAELMKNQAIKRQGQFDDVINVLDFFINDKSNFISGQTIYLGGVS